MRHTQVMLIRFLHFYVGVSDSFQFNSFNSCFKHTSCHAKYHLKRNLFLKLVCSMNWLFGSKTLCTSLRLWDFSSDFFFFCFANQKKNKSQNKYSTEHIYFLMQKKNTTDAHRSKSKHKRVCGGKLVKMKTFELSHSHWTSHF